MTVGSTSQWGSTAVIRPGLKVVDGGSGYSQDNERRMQAVNLMSDTSEGSSGAKDYTVVMVPRLTSSYQLGSPSYPVTSEAASNLIGTVESGIGGVSRSEEFRVPAAGVAVHVVAESVRGYVRKTIVNQYGTQPLPDSTLGLAGADVDMVVSAGRPSRMESVVEGLFVGPDVGGAIAYADFVIPQFAVDVTLYGDVHLFDVVWLSQYGDVPDRAPRQNASQQDGYFIVPLPATTMRIVYTGRNDLGGSGGASAGFIISPPMKWGRFL